ncbi:MAG: hypothetical protein JNL32_14680, partial [Candidatus Kapabacteria bacterium]|nr:hypothetical protein [Candidatus Kapabacteria bacterium]
MSIPLIKTKFFVPPLRPEIVVRTRLVEALLEAEKVTLTLVCAPAGFGKSTAVSEWVHQSHVRVAWLSLDKSDNDFVRFIRYATASLQTQIPGLGDGMEELNSTSVPIVESIGTIIINELSMIDEHVYLVLDDVHTIVNPTIMELLSFLIDNAPPLFHIVIVSRHEPDIPLHRYRANGNVVEIRLHEIRFTLEEATQLFNTTLRLRLNEQHVQQLEQKTEGWVAGLQMAALSLKQRTSYGTANSTETMNGFVASFTGTDSFILDYLMEEVLNKLDEETRISLMILSLFNEFSGELLDYVSGTTNGTVLLHSLLHDNIYIIPLDNERTWFRFHHLFRDLLSHRRQRLIGNDWQIHKRAAEWYFMNAMTEQALVHLVSINDVDTIHSLVKKYWKEIADQYEPAQLHTVAQLIEKSDPTNSPELLFLLSLVTLDNRTPDKIEKSVQYNNRAFILLQDASVQVMYEPQELTILHAALSMSRLTLSYHQLRYDETLEYYKEHIKLLSAIPPQSVARWYLSESTAMQIIAHTLFITSRIPDGVMMYENIVDMFKREGKSSSRIAEAMLNCARGEIALGTVDAARNHIISVLNEFAPEGMGMANDNRAHAFYLLSRLEYDEYHLDNAMKYNQEALQCWERSLWRDPAILYTILEDAYSLSVTSNQQILALKYLRRYEELLSSGKAPAYAPTTAKTLIATTALSVNDTDTARDWAEEYKVSRTLPSNLTPSFMLHSDLVVSEYALRTGDLP